MTITELEALIDELHIAAQAYYQNGDDSGLTDEEYDAKLEYLATHAQGHPELFEEGTRGHALLDNEVAGGTALQDDAPLARHEIPMLSLAKAKTKDEIISYADKARKAGAKTFMLQAKLDGFAISAIYKDGAVDSLSTRGDGEVGESATHLLTADNLTIAGLPRTLELEGEVEIRGEIFFTDAQFEAVNRERVAFGEAAFKNSRNAASGLQKRAINGIPFKTEFTFCAYSVYVDGSPVDLKTLSDSVETVSHLTRAQAPNAKLSGLKTNAELNDAIEAFGKIRQSFTIPTDGVVVKPEDEAKLLTAMGNTSHHPASQIAFKYPGTLAETTVTAIDLTVGKTGRVTPVARVKTVDIDGWEISNVSIHNFNWAHTRNVRVGSVVMVTRAHDVIPQIAAVISSPEDSSPLEVPTTCPVCGSTLVYSKEYTPPRLIQCKNYNCASRGLFALRTACGRDYLDIDGLSGIMLTALVEEGKLTSIADLYRLTVDSMKDVQVGVTAKGNPKKLGEVRAKKIIADIEASKEKPLHKVLASLGVDALGRTASKALLKSFGSLEGIRRASKEEIAKLDNFGEVRAESISAGLARVSPMIDEMLNLGVKFAVPEAAANGARLAGLSFAISGAVPEGYGNRNAFVEFLESEGATFHSAPKAETSYMIGDSEATSSKAVKAKKLGVTFIAPDEFDTLLTSD